MKDKNRIVFLDEGDTLEVALRQNKNVCIQIKCLSNKLYVEDILYEELEESRQEKEEVEKMKRYLEGKKSWLSLLFYPAMWYNISAFEKAMYYPLVWDYDDM